MTKNFKVGIFQDGECEHSINVEAPGAYQAAREVAEMLEMIIGLAFEVVGEGKRYWFEAMDDGGIKLVSLAA